MKNDPDANVGNGHRFFRPVWWVVAGLLGCLLLANLSRRPTAEASPNNLVTATFKGYELAAEDNTTIVAVLSLTNASSNHYAVLTPDNFMTSSCEYRLRTANGWETWVPPKTQKPMVGSEGFGPFSSIQVQVPLPESGKVGKVAVRYYTPIPTTTNEIVKAFRRLWWRIRPPKVNSQKAWCDHEISFAEAEQAIAAAQHNNVQRLE